MYQFNFRNDVHAVRMSLKVQDLKQFSFKTSRESLALEMFKGAILGLRSRPISCRNNIDAIRNSINSHL